MLKYFSDDHCDRLLNTASHWGIILLYSCCLSYKTRKPFLLNQVCEHTENRLDENYAWGYLVASSSAKCFMYNKTNTPEKKKNIIITDFDEVLLEKIETNIYSRFNRPNHEHYLVVLKKIESIFDYTPSTKV